MKFKYNGQWYDITVKALDSMEIGCIIQFMGNTIPTGWLECDGSSITQSDYPELYALIGGTLPNFKGRVLVGQDTSDTDFDTLGETGGQKNTRMSDFGDGLRNGDNGTDWVCQGINVTRYVSHLQPYAVVKHIIKAKNTTPTMASIVNGYSTSTQDGYSCDYINDCNTYSTTETDTGKTWIDGKPIYRKVIDYTGSVGTNSGDNTDIGEITNLEKVINYSAMIKTGTTIEDHIYISYAYNNISTDQWQCYRVYIDDSTKKVRFNVQRGSSTSPRTIDEIIVIVEYTKTTD